MLLRGELRLVQHLVGARLEEKKAAEKSNRKVIGLLNH